MIKKFKSVQGARNYRQKNGSGGWVFESSCGRRSILFPFYMTPTQIINHSATKGMGGRLVP